MKKGLVVLISMLLLAILAISAGCSTQTQPSDKTQPQEQKAKAPYRLRYASTQPASGAYAPYAAIVSTINQNVPEVSATLIDSGGAIDNINLLRREEIDIGLGTTGNISESWKGTGDWAGKGFTDHRLVYVTWVQPQTVFVTEDSGVKTIYDLEGKNFSPGPVGSATEKAFSRILEVTGIKPKAYVGSMQSISEAFRDGRIVGFVKGGAPDAVVIELAASKKLRVLEMPPDVQVKVNKAYPGLVAWPKVAAGTYDFQKEDVVYFGVTIADYTSKKLSEDIVYKIVKAVNEHPEKFMESYKTASESVKTYGGTIAKQTVAAGESEAPLHLGAYRYYKEIGMNIPASLIPPEAK